MIYVIRYIEKPFERQWNDQLWNWSQWRTWSISLFVDSWQRSYSLGQPSKARKVHFRYCDQVWFDRKSFTQINFYSISEFYLSSLVIAKCVSDNKSLRKVSKTFQFSCWLFSNKLTIAWVPGWSPLLKRFLTYSLDLILSLDLIKPSL